MVTHWPNQKMLDSLVENDPTYMREKMKNTNITEIKKKTRGKGQVRTLKQQQKYKINSKKQTDIQNANNEKDETAPTKILRSEKQKVAKLASSMLALKSQLENILPQNNLNLRDSPQPPPVTNYVRPPRTWPWERARDCGKPRDLPAPRMACDHGN